MTWKKIKNILYNPDRNNGLQQQLEELQKEYIKRIDDIQAEQKKRANGTLEERQKRMEQIQAEHDKKIQELQKEFQKKKQQRTEKQEEPKQTLQVLKEKQEECKQTLCELQAAQKEKTKELLEGSLQKTQDFREEARNYAQSARKALRMRYLAILACAFAGLAALLCNIDTVRSLDYFISDSIYKYISYTKSTSSIKIIAVDEETEDMLGNYENWSRNITSDFIETLNRGNGNNGSTPSVIGFALDYTDAKPDGGDEALVSVCKKYDNLCFRTLLETEEDKIKASKKAMDNDGASLKLPEQFLNQYTDNEKEPKKPSKNNMLGNKKITNIFMPFDDLLEVITTGVINTTMNAEDGLVRSAVASVTINQTEVDSFAVALYKLYMDAHGREYALPKLDKNNSFGFNYTSTKDDYKSYSFYDVYSGKIDTSVFADSIVLVGNYTEDQNMLSVPNNHRVQMHELEVQANILTSLLEQNTIRYIPWFYLTFVYSIFAASLFLAMAKTSQKKAAISLPCILAATCLLNTVLNHFDYYLPFMTPLLLIVLIIITNLILRFAIMKHSRAQMESVLKKYVDAQVVNEIVRDGYIEAKIGVMKKDIAVLFVDIRGFTSLSEVLAPEEVVEILNSYLTLVYKAVTKNNGTLDKFIGDAAMAVFNSPSDLDDYVFKAVQTAWDIRSSAQTLNQMCRETFDTEVAFGIGVHCGEAVTGNIGCDTRMDYTAIGDTVNTASRLEGAAGKSEILISETVYDRLRGRINVNYAGEYSLKGKQKAVPAYSVIGIAQPNTVPEQELSNTKEIEGHI